MFKEILTKLSVTRSRKATLAQILEEPFHREGFLGFRRDAMPNPDQIVRDNDRVIVYARSDDYAVWANEQWALILQAIDKLMDPDLEATQVDFYRGKLAQGVDSLRISYKAVIAREEAIKLSKQQRKP